MSEGKSGSSEAVNGLGAFAAFICFFLGFEHGGWPGGAIAAVVAFGSVHLVFAAISLALRLIVGAVILLAVLVSLNNRLEWLVEFLR